METELAVLTSRIAALERLVGQPDTPGVSLHSALTKGVSKLREHVPDELAAATRAVQMLSLTTGNSIERVGDADALVSGTAVSLEEMTELQAAVHGDVVLPAGLELVQAKLAEAEDSLDGVEGQVEKLLISYNSAIAGLNCRLVVLAGLVRELERRKSGKVQ